jgi:dihydrodipicolinate synthase/N-acetylneuraminate lyase
MVDVSEIRRGLISEVLPAGVPRLWCPPLTHYRDDGGIDFNRMSAHLGHLGQWVNAYLIPGTTGDAWELGDRETVELIKFAVAEARKRNFVLLLGVLRPDAAAVRTLLDEMMTLVRSMTGKVEMAVCLRSARIVAFTVCPPKGAALTQAEIESDLSAVLHRGVPTALYQLPQMTENEIVPETFERLVKKHANLIFFKDASGNDRIALSDVDKGGVFLARGVEGDYAQSLKDDGGPYDGFLLSTANCFPIQLTSVIRDVENHNLRTAMETSNRIATAFREVSALVASMPLGNAFTKVNKAIDHFSAFGPSVRGKEGPLLHAGVRVAADIISGTSDILARLDLMPRKGYLE